MRKITKDAVNAFYNGESFKRDNTQIYINEAGENCLKLYNTIIAKILWSRKLWLNTNGWTSNTTKERLNGVLDKLGMRIYQKNFKWYIVDNNTNQTIDFVDGMEITL